MEMEEKEIVCNYLQAADRKNQITILSELNLCSVDEIIDILFRHGAVREKVNSSLLHVRPSNSSLGKRLFLYKLGKSDRDIADELNISIAAVKKWRNRRGLSPNFAKKEPYEKTDAKQMWLEGKNDTQIAEERGVTPSAVCQWRKRNGLHRNAERRWVPKKGTQS